MGEVGAGGKGLLSVVLGVEVGLFMGVLENVKRFKLEHLHHYVMCDLDMYD